MAMETDATRFTMILASSSPRRQELAGLLGLPLVIRPSQADESTPENWPPARVVEELALRKARAVWEVSKETMDRPAIVVGSDTIVALDGRILGKPRDQKHAAEMLGMLSGRTHEVYTGLCCIGLQNGKTVAAHNVSKVTFGPMSNEEIQAYIKTGEPLDKAGAYGVQGIGSVFIEKIEGDFYSIMGLPLNLLYQMLLMFGISLFNQSLLS